MKYNHSKNSIGFKLLLSRIIQRKIPYETFTEKCLNLLKPTKEICEKTLKQFPYDIVDGACDFINMCKEKGKQVYIVSGGYEPVPFKTIFS